MKKNIYFPGFLPVALLAGAVCIAGCAATGTLTQALTQTSTQTTGQTVSASSPQQHAINIDTLAVMVDSLSEQFMTLPGYRRFPSGIKERWSSLVSEAEHYAKTVHTSAALEYCLGELNRIGIFFSAPDAAHMAEYYLTECVGIGGEETFGYKAFLSLAWLYLYRGCQGSDKTSSLLAEAEKRIQNKEYPYLAMLWGYYYYSCKRDPEKSMGFFQTYLAFDPLDKEAVKTYKSIKKQLKQKAQ